MTTTKAIMTTAITVKQQSSCQQHDSSNNSTEQHNRTNSNIMMRILKTPSAATMAPLFFGFFCWNKSWWPSAAALWRVCCSTVAEQQTGELCTRSSNAAQELTGCPLPLIQPPQSQKPSGGLSSCWRPPVWPSALTPSTLLPSQSTEQQTWERLLSLSQNHTFSFFFRLSHKHLTHSVTKWPSHVLSGAIITILTKCHSLKFNDYIYLFIWM